MRFEELRHASNGVCFAEDAGDSLPRGEDSDGRFCRGRLAGHTASVRRRSQCRAVERRVWREEGQRTAAAMDAIAGFGVELSGVGLRARDLQVLLGQVVHFDLNWGGDWVVDGVMCRR